MYILRENNNPEYIFDLIKKDDEDIFYCVFDFKLPELIDYYFQSLEILELFSTTLFVAKIDNLKVFIPKNFKILIGESFLEKLDLISIEECIDRDFQTFLFNPFLKSKYYFKKIEIISLLPERKIFLPKLSNTQFLLSPLSKKSPELCLFLTNEDCKLETINLHTLIL